MHNKSAVERKAQIKAGRKEHQVSRADAKKPMAKTIALWEKELDEGTSVRSGLLISTSCTAKSLAMARGEGGGRKEDSESRRSWNSRHRKPQTIFF